MQSFRSEVSGSYCAWSPDDSKLLVCGTDNAVRLWDPLNGVLLHTFTQHKDQVTSAVWLPDNEHFITGACEKVMCLWVRVFLKCFFNHVTHYSIEYG